jgi:3-oxoisoapionate decarboxylase
MNSFPQTLAAVFCYNNRWLMKQISNKHRISGLGIASTSFMGTRLGKRTAPTVVAPGVSATSTLSVPDTGEETVDILERCHSFGATGVQSAIQGDPHSLRRRAEELGMWVEAMVSVRNQTTEALEQSILRAKQAGATLARDGLLGGRRYESFPDRNAWTEWVSLSLEKLSAAIPIFEKHKFTLALENHKDWTTEEFVSLFQKYSSEFFGACLDFGNNISLLEDPMETITTVAPFVKATHVKDMAIAPDPEGFLLSEVPLGQGFLDLPRAFAVLQSANPSLRFSLEMITRDPLRVPCLTDHYWDTFPHRNEISLARTLRLLEENRNAPPLPTPESDEAQHEREEISNIQACFEYFLVNKEKSPS